MLETYREPWADFLQVPSLCRRAGCSASLLSLVAAKELIDNALDASPNGIDVRMDGRTLFVSDRGAGLSRDRILAIFGVNRPSLSSKRWRLARRGALGNGVRVVMGVAFVSGGFVTVESGGLSLTLSVAADGGTRIMAEGASDVSEGSRVTLAFGEQLHVDTSAIRRYAALCQCAPGSAFGGTKAVPSWFDAPAVLELLRDAAVGTSVLDFAKAFDVTQAALAAIKDVASRTTTKELLVDDARLASIIAIILAGQAGSRELKRMGRNAREGAYAFEQGILQLQEARMPCLVEAWVRALPVKDRKTDGKVTVGTVFANRTPALMTAGQGTVNSDTRELVLWMGTCRISVEEVLKGPCSFDIDLAITAPELPVISDGKAIEISVFRDLIGSAVAAALPRAYRAPTGKVEKSATRDTASIKGAVYELVEDVYASIATADIGVPPRMLMYRCRPDILRLTGREDFAYSTFINALHDFIDDHPERTANWHILYDDRGHFIEPRGARFGLGTQAVDSFIQSISDGVADFDPIIRGFAIEADAGRLHASANPAERFGAVVFVEKEGYTELIRNAKIAERFDVAFCSTKGVPNTSVRRLLDALTSYGIKVFCLHDLDITGLKIANTLATSNRRYQLRNDLDFVDMGVRLADAKALHLESEPFKLDDKTNKANLRERLRTYGATDAEITMLVDDRQRIEIDAMTPLQLIGFIEGKLVDHGVGKIVPSEEAMVAHFRKAAFDLRLYRAMRPLRAELMLQLEEFADEIRESDLFDIEAPPLRSLVSAHLQHHPDLTWIDAVGAIAAGMEGGDA